MTELFQKHERDIAAGKGPKREDLATGFADTAKGKLDDLFG
jgi:hypothetical protein